MCLLCSFFSHTNDNEMQEYFHSKVIPKIETFISLYPLPSDIDLSAFDLIDFIKNNKDNEYILFIILIWIYIDQNNTFDDLLTTCQLKLKTLRIELHTILYESWLKGKPFHHLGFNYQHIPINTSILILSSSSSNVIIPEHDLYVSSIIRYIRNVWFLL